jgi:hypothetical protein
MPPIVIPQTGHLDANETAFFARQLEHILARIFEMRFPALKARLMFPVNNEAGPGVDYITWHELNYVGMAALIADYTTNLPRVDAFMRENQVKVRHLGDAFGYSIFDIQKANRTGVPLAAYKGTAARKAAELKADQLAFTGDSTTGLAGLLSHPNIPWSTVAANGNQNGATNSTLWVNKTPDQIIADVTNVWKSIKVVTKEAEMANVLALPTDQHSYISTTPRSSVSDTTILEFLLKNLEGCEDIISCGRLAGAGAGGADVMAAYDRSPDTAELHIPMEFYQLPPELKNLEWVVNCLMDFAGLIVYRPLAFAIAEGI